MFELFKKNKKLTKIYSISDAHNQMSTESKDSKLKRAFSDDQEGQTRTDNSEANSSFRDSKAIEKNNNQDVTYSKKKAIPKIVTSETGKPEKSQYQSTDSNNHEKNTDAIHNKQSQRKAALEDNDKVFNSKNKIQTENEKIEKLEQKEPVVKIETNIPKGVTATPIAPNTIIDIDDFTLRLGSDQEVILSNINLKIERGEFVFLIGASGAGKTTLMNAINYQYRKKSFEGKLIVDKYDLSKIKRKHIYKVRRKLGYIFQDFKLLEEKNVFENIALSIEVLNEYSKNKDLATRVLQLLSLVDLEDREGDSIQELSGGEKQRLSIARALASNPLIILADEPTGNLDDATGWKIVDILKKLNEQGTTVIFGTHNKDIVNTLKQRVIKIENGNIVSDKKNSIYE